jgi:hypothetical protein
LCMKYSREIDTGQDPCPHPAEYCPHRESCIINRLCTERKDCREKRRAARCS